MYIKDKGTNVILTTLPVASNQGKISPQRGFPFTISNILFCVAKSSFDIDNLCPQYILNLFYENL